MVSLWQNDLDTMKWLDWRARIIDSEYAKVDGSSQVAMKQMAGQWQVFTGYNKPHIDLQVDIYRHLPLLFKHFKTLLSKLHEQHKDEHRLVKKIPYPITFNGLQCGPVGTQLIHELETLSNNGHDFTVFQVKVKNCQRHQMNGQKLS